jgi:hypothetical protein
MSPPATCRTGSPTSEGIPGAPACAAHSARVPGAPAFVGHGVAAGDGYASRSAVAGRRTSLCASCDPHGPRARRGSFPADRDRERGVWWASRGGEGRPAAARQEPSAAREGRTPDRAGSRWPDPPTGSPSRDRTPRSADRLAPRSPAVRSADRLALQAQLLVGRRFRWRGVGFLRSRAASISYAKAGIHRLPALGGLPSLFPCPARHPGAEDA